MYGWSESLSSDTCHSEYTLDWTLLAKNTVVAITIIVWRLFIMGTGGGRECVFATDLACFLSSWCFGLSTTHTSCFWRQNSASTLTGGRRGEGRRIGEKLRIEGALMR